MLDVLIIATLILGIMFGTALYMDNQDAIARIGARKDNGWEKLDTPILIQNKKVKKTQRFYEKKSVPQQDVIKLKDGNGAVWKFKLHYLTEPAKDASLGGKPDFIYLIYDENPTILFQEAKETAYKMQLKSLLGEITQNTASINNRLYGMGKTYKANKSWFSSSFGGMGGFGGYGGYGGGYGGSPLGGLGARYSPPSDVRSLDEGGEEE